LGEGVGKEASGRFLEKSGTKNFFKLGLRGSSCAADVLPRSSQRRRPKGPKVFAPLFPKSGHFFSSSCVIGW
jgi:hypothetical protein